ncbi:putative Dimethyltryptamine 4-hydroxylase (PsiH) [Gymnopilus dilepis]|uniref:Putative Dimethyltryptamine 4-hydroxylase (PsiH) n=1 Tax=Gymnopilus dilepis TaxID=231916 RepID=A0A409VX99_9AGAR|nr:putative Dimethyltryptamine 4-hydroxylase (PsiH) [Gymnopilus dilepis]
MQGNPAVLLLLLTLTLCVYYAHSRRARRARLPPGPPGIPLPFVGNLFDMPSNSPWLTYLQWGETYQTDIIYLNAGGTEMVILNTLEAITDLLEKRGSIYSGRFESTMVNELMGWDFDLGFITYGERWREERRMFSKEFNEKNIKQFRHAQIRAANLLVGQLTKTPERWHQLIRHQIAAMSLDIGYGIDLLEGDPWLEATQLANEGLAIASVPGSFWVDSLPILKYMPSWFPGAEFKRKAKVWRESTDHMINMPYEKMKKLMVQDLVRPSYASARLQEMDPNGDLQHQEHVIRNTAMEVNVGGADTTVSAVAAFILAMVKYPDVQRKVQAELDAVGCRDELPEFDEDNDALPYLTACVKEIFRWNQVAPLAIPHRLDKDDHYRGYIIPKNALVFANTWAVLNDPSVYPDPSEFRPERYLGPDGKPDPRIRDPRKAAFGYGRRACPGIHLAQSTVWIVGATLLSVFDIERPMDANGKPIDIPAAFTTGFFRYSIHDCLVVETMHPANTVCVDIPNPSDADSFLVPKRLSNPHPIIDLPSRNPACQEDGVVALSNAWRSTLPVQDV